MTETAADVRKTGKAFGESLSDFPDLTEAERKLIDACRTGKPCNFDEEAPEIGTEANTIRPELIRFLLLGGDEKTPVHPTGVRLRGAWIGGDLDLVSCHCSRPLLLPICKIGGELILYGAELPLLSLAGSHISGIRGDGLRVRGDVSLRRGFKADGPVRLVGATIGGNMDCENGSFNASSGFALVCDRAVIAGNVFLRSGFLAEGLVRLLGAQIGGNLECDKGSFTAKEGIALNLDHAVITGGLFFRNVTAVTGTVDLSACTAEVLVDDAASWGMVPRLSLNGFRYGRISYGPTDATTRIAWLKTTQLKGYEDEFWPQPWEKLIKVLREMGHEEDAKLVAMAKQDEMRARGKIRPLARPFHALFGWLAGYGYRPLRTVGWMLGVWLSCSVLYLSAGVTGTMAPSDALTVEQHADDCGKPVGTHNSTWTTCPNLPKEYTTFNPWLYSLDVILPLVDLQQEKLWAPLVMKDDAKTWIWQGVFARWVMWFEILFGWVGSLLLAAVLGNLPKRD